MSKVTLSFEVESYVVPEVLAVVEALAGSDTGIENPVYAALPTALAMIMDEFSADLLDGYPFVELDWSNSDWQMLRECAALMKRWTNQRNAEAVEAERAACAWRDVRTQGGAA